jgi:hypothetical protein
MSPAAPTRITIGVKGGRVTMQRLDTSSASPGRQNTGPSDRNKEKPSEGSEYFHGAVDRCLTGEE